MAMSPAEARKEQAAWRRNLTTFAGPLGNPLPYGNEQFELCADGRQVAIFNCLEDARRVRDAINALLLADTPLDEGERFARERVERERARRDAVRFDPSR